MNGAAVVAEILKREGTEFLSCYPRNPLIETCAELDIRTILCRQERVGVGIADGYSRIAAAGSCASPLFAQAGPWIDNVFPGVAQAFTENVPVSSFRPACRWTGNISIWCSAPPTLIVRSPSGRRWRIQCRSCPADAARLSRVAQRQGAIRTG